MVQKGATMSERTELEREIIAAIHRSCNNLDSPRLKTEVRAARILIDHWERHGLVAMAERILSARDFGEKMRARS